ncbi:MAG: SulP family inorganic anion transporter [Planctomycetes bacterium]|nr:SulP family inorganic anion transporter [Planctomycetota bacterium]
MSEENSLPTTNSSDEIPRGNAAGFAKYFKQDILSGFLVFLIALPLCLGIALACGYPAIAGVFTAIIGAIMATFISDSELTIKGPAAGLIVIAIGTVEAFGGDGPIGGFSEADMTAYKMALAVGVVAAILQVIFGFLRAGILAEFFPLAAVHGMLAAIGVIIMVKQIPIALGVRGAKGEPLEMIKEIPHFFSEMNPEIAMVGGISLAIMFLWPWIKKLHSVLNVIPAPMIVLLVAVPMGMFFDLQHTHIYSYHGEKYQVGEEYLVAMPDRVFGMFDDITYPDFSALKQPVAWKWVFMFFVIGSLESLLSAKAIDLLDPWKRKTNLNRDMIAVGVGNVACAMVGGLPMISEIVRSKANIDNGARTRFADLWHGIFLLLCVALIPTILHLIPLAALAAMLVFTGFRLAHPTEFLHVLKIGKEQLLIFVVTLVAVLATDLLIGIAIGIAVKLLIHVINGVPLQSIFKPYLDVENRGADTVLITARYSAIFSNWILFRKQLVDLGLQEKKNIILDLAHTKLVDHSVMEKLHEIQADFMQVGLELKIVGLENHHGLSSHELSTQKLGKPA